MRRYVVNSSDLQTARDLRRKFYDKEPEREEAVPWDWPEVMREVGTCEAVMYTSDKWKAKGDFEDYKHRKEGPQYLLVTEGFIRDYHNTRREVHAPGPTVEIDGMPSSFAVLAPILGVQAQLYEDADNRDGYVLPKPGQNLYQIDIPGAMLGAATHPDSGDTFLIVYTRGGVHALIVGDELSVEKDGIVG